MSKLYEFRQNNSGGRFIGSQYVLIEANDAAEANDIATRHGIYFDGCKDGSDCNCCGDRWYKVDEYNTENFFNKISFTPSINKKYLLDTYYNELYDRFGFVFSEPSHDFIFKDGTKFNLVFSFADIEAIKKKARNTKKSFYAFSYYYGWNSVSSITKVYESDYCVDDYYDSSGNFYIKIPKGKPGVYTPKDSPIYCSYTTKEEAELEREKVIKILTSIKTEVQTIINSDTTLNSKIKKYLLKDYK